MPYVAPICIHANANMNVSTWKIVRAPGHSSQDLSVICTIVSILIADRLRRSAMFSDSRALRRIMDPIRSLPNRDDCWETQNPVVPEIAHAIFMRACLCSHHDLDLREQDSALVVIASCRQRYVSIYIPTLILDYNIGVRCEVLHPLSPCSPLGCSCQSPSERFRRRRSR